MWSRLAAFSAMEKKISREPGKKKEEEPRCFPRTYDLRRAGTNKWNCQINHVGILLMQGRFASSWITSVAFLGIKWDELCDHLTFLWLRLSFFLIFFFCRSTFFSKSCSFISVLWVVICSFFFHEVFRSVVVVT